MRFFLGATDNRGHAYLARRRPDEVNFRRPRGTSFQALLPGAPFLFKLHCPFHFIVGGGYFVHSERLSLSLARDGSETRTAHRRSRNSAA